MNKALVYCRVSSQKQVTEGDGLGSQESRCRKYAHEKGYEVERVFPDEGISGGLFDRPEMKRLLDYLDKYPTRKYVVIIDDLSRLARDVTVHLKLKNEFGSRGAILESPNYNFDDTPEGAFIELILAGKAQLDRQQNKRQVCQKMKARLEAGYWTFHQPPGYKFAKSPLHGKILTKDEPNASIIKEALELFAHNILESQQEVLRFLQREGIKTQRGGEIAASTVKKILTQPLYAGIIVYPKWDLPHIEAKHESLIDVTTHQKILDRLGENPVRVKRPDMSELFPLRGFVCCSECNRPLTGSYNTGRTKKYANYSCQNRKDKCSLGGKAIPKDKIEAEFAELLKNIKPAPFMFSLVREVVKDTWNSSLESFDNGLKKNELRLKEVKSSLKSYEKDYRSTNSEVMKRRIEKNIETLDTEERALELIVKQGKKASQKVRFEDGLELVFDFIKDPYLHWATGKIKDKLLVLKLVFSRPIPYDRTNGFGTVEKTLPFQLLQPSHRKHSAVVEVAGIEPASEEENYYRLHP